MKHTPNTFRANAPLALTVMQGREIDKVLNQALSRFRRRESRNQHGADEGLQTLGNFGKSVPQFVFVCIVVNTFDFIRSISAI